MLTLMNIRGPDMNPWVNPDIHIIIQTHVFKISNTSFFLLQKKEKNADILGIL